MIHHRLALLTRVRKLVDAGKIKPAFNENFGTIIAENPQAHPYPSSNRHAVRGLFS